jgi:hypothetical protein
MHLIRLNHSAKLAKLPFDVQHIVYSHMYDIVLDELATYVYEFRADDVSNRFELGVDRYFVCEHIDGVAETVVHWPGSKSVSRFRVGYLNKMFRRNPDFLKKPHLYGINHN